MARPRMVAPATARQQWRRAKAVREAGPEAAVLYAEESRRPRLPLMRARGPGAGEPRRVPTPGTHGTRALGGALKIRPGRGVSLVRARRRQADCLACVAHLLVASPQGPIVPIVDHVSRHTAHAVPVWWAAPPRRHGCSWPKDWSPVKPVARSWLRLKTMLAPPRLDGSLHVRLETVEGFFTAMTPEHALQGAAA